MQTSIAKVAEIVLIMLLVFPKISGGENPQISAAEIEALKVAALGGDAFSQFNLGVAYRDGLGVAKDPTAAADWFRKASEQGHSMAQTNLGIMYAEGQGVTNNEKEAVKWFLRAAEQGNTKAQMNLAAMYASGRGTTKNDKEAAKWRIQAARQGDALGQLGAGFMYVNGKGVSKDEAEGFRWYLKAAEQGLAAAQLAAGIMLGLGQGTPKDAVHAVKWFRQAAEQNNAEAQYLLGIHHATGEGTLKDESEGYKWLLMAGANGNEKAKEAIKIVESSLTLQQRAEGQRNAKDFQRQMELNSGNTQSMDDQVGFRLKSSGSGFFITEDGFAITNQHVATEGAKVSLLTANGSVDAVVVRTDRLNDLSLLKATGRYVALPIAPSRSVRLGATVATIGFPNIRLQGFSPKLSKGEIASLAGALDDPRHFQISVPIQPGNSGGALVDADGNVIGIVAAKLDQTTAIATTGVLAENVNYAVKSGYLLSFLESLPEVSAGLKVPLISKRKFEDVIKDVQQASVLVLVY